MLLLSFSTQQRILRRDLRNGRSYLLFDQDIQRYLAFFHSCYASLFQIFSVTRSPFFKRTNDLRKNRERRRDRTEAQEYRFKKSFVVNYDARRLRYWTEIYEKCATQLRSNSSNLKLTPVQFTCRQFSSVDEILLIHILRLAFGIHTSRETNSRYYCHGAFQQNRFFWRNLSIQQVFCFYEPQNFGARKFHLKF